MASNLDILINATDRASGPIGNVGRSLDNLSGKSQGLLSRGLNPLKSMLETGLKVAAGAAVVAVGALGVALAKGVGQAMNMEQAVADIAAVMGKSVDEIIPLKALIEDLGLDPKLKVTAIEAAGAALQAHDYATAASLYSTVLQGEPENLVALAGLAQCHIALGNLDQARGLLSQVPDEKQSDAALAGVLAALDLAEKTSHLGNPDDLVRKLESEPDDHQTRFDLALALNGRGDRSGAVEQLVTILSRDREWNEDAARKQLLQFFEAWGASDPATQNGRQRLSSVLFS